MTTKGHSVKTRNEEEDLGDNRGTGVAGSLAMVGLCAVRFCGVNIGDEFAADAGAASVVVGGFAADDGVVVVPWGVVLGVCFAGVIIDVALAGAFWADSGTDTGLFDGVEETAAEVAA